MCKYNIFIACLFSKYNIFITFYISNVTYFLLVYVPNNVRNHLFDSRICKLYRIIQSFFEIDHLFYLQNIPP